MKYLFSSLFLLLIVLALPLQRAAAQTMSSAPGSVGAEQTTRKGKKAAKTDDVARMQRRMTMNPDEAKRDQQLEVLEARSGMTANTSFGRGSGPARQYDKAAGGFTLKKFKDKRHGTARQKRGQSHPAPGIDPKGKPLTHKYKAKKHFLFF